MYVLMYSVGVGFSIDSVYSLQFSHPNTQENESALTYIVHMRAYARTRLCTSPANTRGGRAELG